MEKIIVIIGVEALTLCCIILVGVQWGRKLDLYLRRNHSMFYDGNLRAPILAGGPADFLKHFRALRTIYQGSMPDDVSSAFQKKVRFYGKIGILWLVIFFLTLISIPFYHYFMMQ